MRKLLRVLLLVCGVALLIVAATLLWGYRATQRVPDFYVAALEKPAAEPKQAADEFEREVLELQNGTRRAGEWQATFTTEEINGWLAHDLPIKFPDALPAEVSAPRVAIDRQMIQVACKYAGPQLTSVISLGVEPQVTSDPNVIAVRIRRVRAGSLPIPLGKFLDQISQHSAAAGLPLRWSEQEGDPLAIITLPLERSDLKGKVLRLKSIELREGEVVISGETEEDVPTENGAGEPSSDATR